MVYFDSPIRRIIIRLYDFAKMVQPVFSADGNVVGTIAAIIVSCQPCGFYPVFIIV